MTVMKKSLMALASLALVGLMACQQISTRVVRVAPQSGDAPGLQVPVKTGVQFKATNEAGNPLTVTWDVVEGASRGTIDGNGNYTAPDNVPSPPTATVRATTTTTPKESGTYVLTIIPQGQAGINGTVTVPVGLLDAPRVEPQAVTATTQQAPVTKFAADWNAARVQGQLLVIPSAGARPQSLSTASSLRGARTQVDGDLLRVQVPAGVSDQVFAAQIAQETGAAVQPNYIYRPVALPNDPEFGKQANLIQIDAPGAWATQTAVNDGLIAVLDTGLVKSLSEIQGRFIEGRDFCAAVNAKSACEGEDGDVTDVPVNQNGNGHGTFIAGQIAAVTGNGQSIAGLTQSGKVLIVKVFSADAKGPLADSPALAKGIKYAVDQGARVLNLSLGVCASQQAAFDVPDQAVSKALQDARAKGAVIVAAAGNNGAGGCGTDYSVQFPGNHPDVIAVGSVNGNNARSAFSATGPQVSLVAPGEAILSLNQSGTLETKSGTSFAAPQVAAVAGLMLSKNGALQTNNASTMTTIKAYLESTAKPLGAKNEYGAGLLQAGAALAKAANPSGGGTKTSVYVYADLLRAGGNPNNDADYDAEGPLVGRTVVTLNGTSGSVSYNITLSRSTQPLKAGTYRITACVNKNANTKACDAGDLQGIKRNVQYNGTKAEGQDVTLSQVPAN
jgi:subtilisin family serine protease